MKFFPLAALAGAALAAPAAVEKRATPLNYVQNYVSTTLGEHGFRLPAGPRSTHGELPLLDSRAPSHAPLLCTHAIG